MCIVCSLWETHRKAMKHHSYGITQCYLLPDRQMHATFTPAMQASTQLIYPGGTKNWVGLGYIREIRRCDQSRKMLMLGSNAQREPICVCTTNQLERKAINDKKQYQYGISHDSFLWHSATPLELPGTDWGGERPPLTGLEREEDAHVRKQRTARTDMCVHY